MNPVSYREATPADARALGGLHVASWRETYAGLLPSRVLDELSADARSAMWKAVLDDPPAHGRAAVFVATSAGCVVGFAACMDQRDEVLRQDGFGGEIGAIYVLRSCQRAGVGRTLMGLAAQHLRAKGHRAATLWVLRENASARAFYESLGGTLVGEKADEASGEALVEVAYGWRELPSFAGPAGRP